MNKACALASLLVGAALMASAPVQAERLDKTGHAALAGHKALYQIEMISKRSGSQILNIHGQMYFALQPGCDGWTTDHRFNLYYEYADSAAMQITSDFSTYEPLDGQSFDFTSRRRRDGTLYQELRGSATRDDQGFSHVTYSTPAGLTYNMAPGGLFPMAHTAAMMTHIRAGHKIFNAVVFDGSDEEGPVEINTIIGKALPAARITQGPAIDAGLVALPARQVRMAFFPLQAEGPTSDYEMDVVLHDNGVISAMEVDYGEFSVSQKLVALEKLAVPACGNDAPKKADHTPAPPEQPQKVAPVKKKLFGLIP
ncbi:MAG TPA: DUF1849 family protein [Micavibrio sp.]